MPPVKFGDIEKVAKDVFDEDHHNSGFQLKKKMKTSWDASVVTTTVDLLPGGKDKVATPAKLSWKFPKPFGISGISVDKFEFDKGGKYKFETSIDKSMHTVADLKVDIKTDLVDVSKASLGCSYTGLKDTLVSLEMVPAKVATAHTIELMRAFGPLTAGIKYSAGKTPDIGCRYVAGPVFASLIAKDGFKTFLTHGHYKATDVLKVACMFEQNAKGQNFGLGVGYQAAKDTQVKAKVMKDQSIIASVKHSLAKGFTLLVGCKYNVATSENSYGVQLSIE